MLIIICLTKQTRQVTCQCGYGVVPGCCANPSSGYQMLSSYLYVSLFLNYDHVTERTQTDRLKMDPRGATKEAPICAVPMHAPQTSSLWSGVGEGSSAGEVLC